MGDNKKIILSVLLCIFNIFLINAINNSSSEKLNVLFIIADDLNCDIGVYGNKDVYTPNIDKLASEGVLFENAHVQYPFCLLYTSPSPRDTALSRMPSSA